MKRVPRKFILVFFGAGLLCGFSGTCLPPNFFADLAGDVIGTTVDTVLNEILEALLNPANAG